MENPAGRFSLVPHAAGGDAPRLSVTGAAVRRGALITIHYRLEGEFAPPPPRPAGEPPRRLDGLWRDTCCELFLAVPGEPGYLEVNVSPALDWNAYRFDACREGGRAEDTIRELPARARRDGTVLELSFTLDLTPAGLDAPLLEAGVSAVVRAPDDKLSYWALRHGGPAPDFHRRDGFTLRLPR
jgi:hypothetical protein